MKICIGIVSYLPDNELRNLRLEHCKRLIEQCDEIFNVPIIFIAQNYKDGVITSKNFIRYDYNKLGIVGARSKLREKFLESDFDMIILFDDDNEIVGTYEQGQQFLKDLESRKDQYAQQKRYLFSGMCVSKALFSKLEIPNLNAEEFEGYEDYAFAQMLMNIGHVPNLSIKTKLVFRHTFKNSTWSRNDNYSKQVHDDMMKRTMEWLKWKRDHL